VGGNDVFAVGLGGDADGGAWDVGIGEDADCAEGGVEVTGAEEVAGFEGFNEVVVMGHGRGFPFVSGRGLAYLTGAWQGKGENGGVGVR
jgi:hypothetical protein